MRRTDVICAFALLSSACVTIEGATEGDEPVRLIDDVEVVGASELDESALTDGLAHHPPFGIFFREIATLDLLTLELDRRRIETYYRDRGFFSARVLAPQVLPADDPDEVVIRFVVEEGPPALVAGVRFQGDVAGLDEDELLAVTRIEVGERFDYARYEEAIENVRSHSALEGHLHARVRGRVEVDRERGTAEVTFIIDQGPIVRFAGVTVTGNERLPTDSVLHRVAWGAGDVFDPKLIDLTEGRVYELGLVGSVRFENLADPGQEHANIKIHVSETTPNELHACAGVGISEVYEVRGRAGYTRRGFFDPLLVVGVELRPSYQLLRGGGDAGFGMEAIGRIVRDDFLLPRVQLSSDLAYALTRREAFSTIGPRVRLGMARPYLLDRLQVGVATELSLFDLRDVNPAVPETELENVGLFDPIRVAALEPHIAYDGRDDPLNPTFGYFSRLSVELGRTLVERAGSFALLNADVRGYLPLFTRRLVLAGRLRVGTAIAGRDAVPIVDRYFSGGSESQRGFGRRRLAPGFVDEEGHHVPVGGTAAAEGSVELRVDVFRLFDEWFGFVLFTDAADVARTIAAMDLANPHLAAGLGVRYDTPVGPIRADFGLRLNRREEIDPESAFAFHLSLGEAF